MELRDDILNAALSILEEAGSMELLRTLCTAAEKEVLYRIRGAAAPEVCRDSLIAAGALLAVCAYRSACRDELAAFDTGSLSLTFQKQSDTLAQLAERILAPWCGGNRFQFRGVRV